MIELISKLIELIKKKDILTGFLIGIMISIVPIVAYDTLEKLGFKGDGQYFIAHLFGVSLIGLASFLRIKTKKYITLLVFFVCGYFIWYLDLPETVNNLFQGHLYEVGYGISYAVVYGLFTAACLWVIENFDF